MGSYITGVGNFLSVKATGGDGYNVITFYNDAYCSDPLENPYFLPASRTGSACMSIGNGQFFRGFQSNATENPFLDNPGYPNPSIQR
jgi:hypothetical protein